MHRACRKRGTGKGFGKGKRSKKAASQPYSAWNGSSITLAAEPKKEIKGDEGGVDYMKNYWRDPRELLGMSARL